LYSDLLLLSTSSQGRVSRTLLYSIKMPIASPERPSKKARPNALPALVAPSSAPSSDNAEAAKDADDAADGALESSKSDCPPPSYGSQEYWEQRYQKHQQQGGKDNDNDDTNEDKEEKDGDHNVSGALPFHAWYFTYQDLRPLILPLILGGRAEARDVMDEALADVPTDEVDSAAVANDGQKGKLDEAGDEKHVADSDEDDEGNASETEEVEEEEEEEDEDDEEEGDFEEVGDDDEEDEEEEEEVDREGLANNGPISVLEVGCGDVPLGADLSLELQKLEQETGGSSQGIVKRIVCIDYSETVVHAMTKQYLSAPPTTTTDTIIDTDKNAGPLEFAVEDARRLSYPNESFELILEKGTLDAMLSNKEEGVANCVEIVSECARVLTKGGFIVIISHLNAHTPNGVSWLEEVVQTGLLAGGGNATWEIEVHGNADISTDGDPGIPAGSPGPAVYIIQKKPSPEVEGSESAKASTSSTQDTTIPVKFFAY
jgi:ubiquinone/menaquinone biosynthesis C-methylase UbiE